MFEWLPTWSSWFSSSIENNNNSMITPDNNKWVHSRPKALAPNYDEYLMNHKNRGQCVVFNHKIFLKSPERKGTDRDVERIERTFKKLGFSIQVYTDYNDDDIRDKIKQLSEENHNDNDCLVVIVLSHGNDHSEVEAKNTTYNIENLWRPFTADKCTTLAGKPKLFFFSTCRGGKRDNGVLLEAVDRTETDCARIPSAYAIPTEADFLFGFGTSPGYVSHRNPSNGTWYITALCSILDKHAATTDLLTMLTKTINEVTKLTCNCADPNMLCGKQIPETHSRLSRLVYFKPKKNANQ